MIENIRIIINEFGGKTDVLFIGLFTISFFLINSLIKNNKLRITFSIFSGMFVILQLASLYFSRSFIGYQFFVHFNLSSADGMIGLYIPQVFISTGLLIILILLFYGSRTFIYEKPISLFKNNSYPQKATKINLVIITLCFGIILTEGSFLSETKSLLFIFYTNKAPVPFEKVLEKYEMNDYITPGKINCKKGKNIIVISLESLEKAFLFGKFSTLTPNLQKLKSKWNYYNLEQNSGSGWTSGSLYTYLTGFPAYLGIRGNSIFKSSYHSKISSISHVLEKAGYNITYMNGNTNNAGIKEMLQALHFDKIIDQRNVKDTGFNSCYGIRDKDLFELAKNEIEKQSSMDQPFAVFISTTDTHFPNGIYDSRMEGIISKKDTDFNFMISAVDYMIDDFISFLNKKDFLSNTTVYIFPDHLKMGDPSMFNNTGDRGLYIITNAEKEALSVDTSETLYQIDLPKIILKGAKVEHNLKFLTDYISGDKNEYIKNHIIQITEINTNGFLRHDSKAILFSKNDIGDSATQVQGRL